MKDVLLLDLLIFLQNEFGGKYFIDCDYNSSVYFDKENKKLIRKSGKPISDLDQNETKITKRFIDIIVHRRRSSDFNLICFELKKWNSKNSKDKKDIRPTEKDKNNLKVLTSRYGYEYGFHLIFGKTKEKTEIEIFKDGRTVNKYLLFNH